MKYNILWIIAHPKYKVMINFEVSKIFKWVVKKLMKHRKVNVKLIKRNKLRGYKSSIVYLDEWSDLK